MTIQFDTENDSSFSVVYFPFNDTSEPVIQRQVSNFNLAKNGIDTREIDRFRQGVSIRTSNHLFSTTMPKMWAGNINHFTNTNTLGQARSFVEFGNSNNFNDRIRKFNPVQFMTDPLYPRPIIFNNGPQQKEEANIYPFDIPFAKDYNEINTSRQIRGTLEDGNEDLTNDNRAHNIVEQFLDFQQPKTFGYFLDEGTEYFGTNAPEESIIIDGYFPLIERDFVPFDDRRKETIVNTVQGEADLIETLKSLKYDLDGDLRQKHNRASMPAGTSVYGINAGLYGTDSIAYSNLIRGA